jgi:hypothetical protein
MIPRFFPKILCEIGHFPRVLVRSLWVVLSQADQEKIYPDVVNFNAVSSDGLDEDLGASGGIWGPSLFLNDTFSGGGAPVRFRVQLVQITPLTMVFVGGINDIFQIFLISGDPKYPGKQYP